MKKTIRIVAALLVMSMLVIALVSCGKTLSGSYTTGGEAGSIVGATLTYKFSGSNVTLISKTVVLGSQKTTETKGSYSIDKASDGSMTITLTFKNDEGSAQSGTFKFDEGKTDDGKAYITIGMVKYFKD